MVSTGKNLSAYNGTPPANGVSGQRLINKGPIYTTQQVLSILQSNSQNQPVFVPFTKKCRDDIQDLTLDADDVIEHITLAITNGRFRNSEWCANSSNTAWAACDNYVFRKNTWIAAASKEMPCDYYLKFAIGKSNKILLIASCHTST